MEAVLDTNFIISCMIKRVDFLEQLEGLGFKVAIPKSVFEELKDLRKNNKASHEEKAMINIALQLFNERKIKRINLGKGKVDDSLIRKGKEGVYIATLDREILAKIPNKIILRGDKKILEVKRN